MALNQGLCQVYFRTYTGQTRERAKRAKLPRDGSAGLEAPIDALTSIGGIGRWTAQYIAMRAFGEPDAFPEGDLGLRRAVSNGGDLVSSAELTRMAERWQPWRAYAAVYLWLGKQNAN